MKNDVLHSNAHVDPSILDNVVLVKETIARIGEKKAPVKKFGVVDMWNIRRNSKYASATFLR